MLTAPAAAGTAPTRRPTGTGDHEDGDEEWADGDHRDRLGSAVENLSVSNIQLGPDTEWSGMRNHDKNQRRPQRHSSSPYSVRSHMGGSLHTWGSAIGVMHAC